MLKIISIISVLFIFNSYAQDLKYDTIPKYSYGTIEDFWKQMDDIFSDPNYANAFWGVVIQSLSTGEYFYKRNENKLFMPASNLKLFTTAAGLLLLGSEYRFTTEVYRRGIIDGTILKGDLIVKGTGDPTYSGRFYNEDLAYRFNLWADSLLELGIDEIQGNIIGDDNAFDDIGLGDGWSWDYESDWYAAPSGAISFNDNCVDIIVTPTLASTKAELNIIPATNYAIIVNDVITVPKDSLTRIRVYRERGTNVITVSGTIKEGSEPIKTYSTINNPTQYFVVVLKDVLESRGIKIKGYPLDVDDMSGQIDYHRSTLLITDSSPPIKDLIRVINKNSQNFFAEQLLKVIGYEKKGLGTSENGISTCEELFSQMGINTDGIIITDGSGLSRLNLVSPNHVNSLLNYMYTSDLFVHYFNSLPIAGVDGSLSNRMKKSRATNNVHAKTGYIGAVRSLSGYVLTGDKELVSFTMIANNFTVPLVLADNIQDLVCQRLASFKRK
jgi:D-alanyl-D-alanine carboxypeptidase/D-alanyl-D-alanine-endopeptidase (penicillin-binding protein 4)